MNTLIALSTPTIFNELDITETTRQDYLARLPQFAGFLKKYGLSNNSLLEYKKYLRGRTDLGVSAKNKYLAVARISLKELYRTGMISVDLSVNVKSFRQSQRHRVIGLNEDEAKRLCDYLREAPDTFQTLRLRALTALLLFQGLRQVEICRLDIDDIDLVNSRLFVLGKGRDCKEAIYLHPQTENALTTYLSSYQTKSGPLFTSLHQGQRLSTRGLRCIVKQTFAQLCIDKTVHGVRHYFTTTLIKSYKADLLRVAQYTRHNSTDMLVIYNDILNEKEDLPRYYSAFNTKLN